MKSTLWLIVAVLFLCPTARSQETPAWEISAGYSSLTGNLIHPRFHLNGGNASLAGNLNNWFGIKFDFSAYSGPFNGQQLAQDIQGAQSTPPTTGPLAGQPIAGSPTAQIFSVGPVFSLRRYRMVTPFANFGIGGIHASQGYIGLPQSTTARAVSVGGGFDVRINNRLAIRTEGHYLSTAISMPPATFSPGSPQGNIQLSAGIVFRIGKK